MTKTYCNFARTYPFLEILDTKLILSDEINRFAGSTGDESASQDSFQSHVFFFKKKNVVTTYHCPPPLRRLKKTLLYMVSSAKAEISQPASGTNQRISKVFFVEPNIFLVSHSGRLESIVGVLGHDCESSGLTQAPQSAF